MPKPIITLIAAVSENNVIGNHNDLPWYIPEDLKRFRALTDGKTIVMGKKTFDSIIARRGSPLPNRKNIVISRQRDLVLPEGVILIHDIQEALELPDEEIMIIGGGQIYKQFMPLADKLLLTHVKQTLEGDVTFPEINWSQWKKTFEDIHEGFTFADYERI